MKTLNLKLESAPIKMKNRLASAGVAYELVAAGASHIDVVANIYSGETSALINDLERIRGPITHAERDMIVSQSAALIAKAAESAGEGIAREVHEIRDDAGKALATLRLEAPFLWPEHEEMACSDAYSAMVCGYFNMLKDNDAVTMILRKECNQALRRDARISFEPRERTPWNPRIITRRVDVDPGLRLDVRYGLGLSTHAERLAQAAMSAADLAEASGRIVRLYNTLRDDNGVMSGVFMVEAPFYEPDPAASERSPMAPFIRPEKAEAV